MASVISPIEERIAAGARRLARWLAGRRHGRALHTQGACAAATLVVEEPVIRPLGVPVFDQPGQTAVLVRLSRGLSLPGRLPDVLGLAVRIPRAGAGGGDLDLLLSTASRLPGLGWLPVPRRSFTAGRYSTLAVYRTQAGAVRLIAEPQGPPVPAVPEALPAALEVTPLTFHLRAQRRGGGTWPVATLRLYDTAEDAGLAFDPIWHGHPGLRPGRWQWRLRRMAYAGSREGSARAYRRAVAEPEDAKRTERPEQATRKAKEGVR